VGGRSAIVLACSFVCCATIGAYADSPDIDGRWVRGSLNGKPTPIWGHADGLRIGLAPLRGPRGLLRVYAPYLDHPDGRVINFIAVESIPAGSMRRGLSELEYSRLDKMPGKRFWSANSPTDASPRESTEAVEGFIEHDNGVDRLCVYILVERFDNGAHVYLKLTFQADRPHEVGISTSAYTDSAPLNYCIVSATMGNYARLRRLRLADRVIVAGDLWPDYRGDGFAPHAKFSLAELIRGENGEALAIAETDEADPTVADYSPDTRPHWKYSGKVATQAWKSLDADSRLEVWVNGRHTYWASHSPIPGGIAFENFEMVSPFQQGQEFWFGVEPTAAGSQ
jgi:hypothetical protein